MNLYVINTGFIKIDGGAMFGIVPKSLWQKTNPSDKKNMNTLALRCLLIEDGNKLILIDNGVGDKQSAEFFRYYYLQSDDTLEKSLNNSGFSTDDVTDVILTHLHFDHCGGSLKYNNDRTKIDLTFKNATYWSNKEHWKWAVEPNVIEKASFLKENILPIEESGHLKFVSPPLITNDEVRSTNSSFVLRPSSFVIHTSSGDGLEIFFSDGHTEKMMIPVIRYKDKTIVYITDLVPSTGHIPIPYVMGYDVQPLLTMKEKEIFLNNAAVEEYILFFGHDPVNECCTLIQTEKWPRVKETFRLKHIL